MRVERFLIRSNFIRHAPVSHGFEGAEDFPDLVMGPAVFLRVVEGQLPFAGSGAFSSMLRPPCYKIFTVLHTVEEGKGLRRKGTLFQGDAVIGIVHRVQVERQGGVALHAGSFTEVVDLDEVIGISGFLGSTFEVELAGNMDFHSFSPLPFWFCISPGNAERLWGSGEAGCSLVNINAPNSPNIKLAIVFLDIMAEKYYCKYY